ncbi:MAG: cytochrome c biogenesis protein CcdA [Bacteroidota bacterium]
MEEITLGFALATGFTHAFEADHLVAVGALATRKKSLDNILREGIFWGLGHSSTILIVGLAFIFIGLPLDGLLFDWGETIVGFMLISLGLWRVYQYRRQKPHKHIAQAHHTHNLAYRVGLIHGLAGSGAVILLLVTQLSSTSYSIFALVAFGLGSVIGMLTAAAFFGIPWCKRLMSQPKWSKAIQLMSATICVGYGLYVLMEQMS